MILSRKSRIVYFWGFLILLLAETGIAVYLKTGFIRANAGDFLVALLLYCLLMFCTKLPVRTGLISTLLFCFSVEILQIVNLTRFFSEENKWWSVLLFGSHFSGLDLLMYLSGVLTAFLIEKVT